MPAAQHEVDAVRASLARCVLERFFVRFYEVFLGSNEAIARKFEHTDLQAQARALRHALMTAILFNEGRTTAQMTLDRLRSTHSRAQMDVEPWMYEIWLNSVLQVVREQDPQASVPVLRAWRRVLSPAIDSLKSGYDPR